MLDSFVQMRDLRQFTPHQLRTFFFSAYPNDAERIEAIQALLSGPHAKNLRRQIGLWVIDRLPAEELVPDRYRQWRPLVQDCMLFMFMHLSVDRLAPKLIEQLELPSDTTTGVRLLKLISKVPGLQKLGQVLARNRHLQRRLRRSLVQLENGISDVDPQEVQRIIREELKQKLEDNLVKISPGIFSEASVSAVVRFTWKNRETGRRERGVFKVLKPHIRASFAEDMDLLARLATYVETKHSKYGFARRVLPEAFDDVRRLLRHEVEFLREQETLSKASRIYASMSSIRIPRLIPELCSDIITAMTEERGGKVTTAAVRLPEWERSRVLENLVEAFVAVPLFSSEQKPMFHADPHAGNLLYDRTSGKLAILDWALTGHVSREQRRLLALFCILTALRDANGVVNQIQAMSRGGKRRKRLQVAVVRECVRAFIDRLPFGRLPGLTDSLNLLETIALKGIRLPAPLIMLRKVLFTLDGVRHDLGDPEVNTTFVLVRHALQRWLTDWQAFGSPLSMKDWLNLEYSSLFYGNRILWQGASSFLDQSLQALDSWAERIPKPN